jgi:hypothetical protein
MGDDLPDVRNRDERPDPLEAESNREAIIVSQWRNSQAVAMGDESKEEWIIAPAAYGLDFMR